MSKKDLAISLRSDSAKNVCALLVAYIRTKTIRMTNVMAFIIVFTCMQVNGHVYSQKININVTNSTLDNVLRLIRQQSDYMLLYNHEAIDGVRGINLKAQNEELENVLKKLFIKIPFSYEIKGKTILIEPKQNTETPKSINQSTDLSARIVDEQGRPIPGVTVRIKNSNIITQTDQNGNFSLKNVKPEDIIQVSYVGFQEIEKRVDQFGKLQTLKEIVNELENVVVTGYQTVNKKLFTGSSTQLKADDVKIDGVTDISRMLEGRAAGVSVQNVSGSFGSAPKMRIRGATSISGENKPLWVIDGVIIEDIVNVSNDELSSGDPLTLLGSSVAGINANDIESFEILKDASATAMYGARAMNGVIVITTKKGRVGKAQVSYNGNFTTYLKPSYATYDVLNSMDQMSIYAEMARKGWFNQSDIVNAANGGVYIKMYERINSYDETSGTFGLENTPEARAAFLNRYANANTNWFDLLFRNSLVQDHSLSVSSGTENSKHYFSASMFNDNGWSVADRVKRYTANVRSDYNLSPKFTLGTIVSGSIRNQTAPGSNSRVEDAVRGDFNRDFDINPFNYALNSSRAITAFDENGNREFFRRSYAPFNILHELENNTMSIKMMDIKLQGELGYKILKNLEFKVLGSMRYVKTSREQSVNEKSNMAQAYRANWSSGVTANNLYLYTDPDFPIGESMVVLPQGGLYNRTDDELINYYLRNTLRWNKDFGGHTTSLFVGQELKYADRDRAFNRGYGYQFDKGGVPFTDYRIIKQLLEAGGNYFGLSHWYDRYVAFFANGSYSYKGKYVFNGTFRYDGSNQMGTSNTARWLPTWTLSGAWNMESEDFIKSINAIDFLKLRGAYGLTASMGSATNSAPIFTSSSSLRPHLSEVESRIVLGSLGNSELTWEKQYEANLGLDMGLFNGKLNFTIDYYDRKGFDLIGPFRTNGIGGQAIKQANYADMSSQGLEITLGGQLVKRKDFSYRTNFTFGYNKNKITNLKSTPIIFNMIGPTGGVKEGGAVRGLYSIKFEGLDTYTGIPLFLTENGTVGHNVFMQSPSIDNLVYEGSVDPVYTGGFSNTFKYKDLSMNVFFTYQAGNKIRLNPQFSTYYSDLNAMSRVFLDRWVKPGDEQFTNVPSILEYRDVTALGSSYPYNNYNFSTARVVDGSFVRLKTVSVSYNLPAKWANSIKANSLSLNAHGTNLWLIYADKNLRGQDPEFFNSGGVAMPMPRQFTLSLKVGL